MSKSWEIGILMDCFLNYETSAEYLRLKGEDASFKEAVVEGIARRLEALGVNSSEIDRLESQAHAEAEARMDQTRLWAIEDAQDDLAKETARQIRDDMIYEEERERRSGQ